MNLIEAWKKAKDGQKIQRAAQGIVPRAITVNHIQNGFLEEEAQALAIVFGDILKAGAKHFLADDWEIVKEKKIFVSTWEEIAIEFIASHLYFPPKSFPDNAKVTIEWEE